MLWSNLAYFLRLNLIVLYYLCFFCSSVVFASYICIKLCDSVKTIFWNNYTAITATKPINRTKYFMRSIVVVHLFLFDGIFLM